MSLAGRVLAAFVGIVVSGVALTVTLLLSFTLGPIGLATGVAGVFGAPLLTLRLTASFTDVGGRLSRGAVCLSIWGAIGLAVGAALLLGIPVTRGDAFDTAWLILAYAAVFVGAVVGTFWPAVGREERN